MLTRTMHSNGPARLVHLQLLPLVTGVQKVTLEEFTALDRAAFEPVLLCQGNGPLSQTVAKLGVPVCYAPSLVRPISPLRDVAALRELLRLCHRLRPDILHTHSSKTGILGRIAARLAGVPAVVHTVHGFAFPYAPFRLVRGIYFAMEFLGGRLCDAVIVLNPDDYRTATERLRIPEGKVHLIPNGVDMEMFAPLSGEKRAQVRREAFGVESGDIVCIGMVGRLWRQKNPLCLLEAAEEVLSRTTREVRFLFIGDGELHGEMERRIAAAGLGAKIRLLGWREDVPALLPGLDVFVLPSRWEGMPLALLEAMAAGVPTVASDIPGNRDLVADGADGLLFQSGDAAALAMQVERLIYDDGLRRTMARAGREKVVKEYPLARRVARMVSLYNHLTGRNNP